MTIKNQIKEIYRFLNRKTKLVFFIMLIMVPILVTFEMLQVIMIIPLLSQLLGNTFSVPILSEFFSGLNLTQVTMLFASLAIINAAMRFISLIVLNTTSFNILKDVSVQLYKSKLANDYVYERNIPESDTINLFTNKLIYLAAHFVSPMLTIYQSIFLTLGIMIILIHQILWLFCVLISFMIVFYSSYVLLSKGITKRNATDLKKLLVEHTGKVTNLATNHKELRLYGLEDRETKTFSNIEIKLRNRQKSAQIIAHSARPFVEGMSYLAVSLIIIISIKFGVEEIVPQIALLAFGAQKLLPNLQMIYSNASLMASGRQVVIEIFESLSRNHEAKSQRSFRVPVYLHKNQSVKSIELQQLKIKNSNAGSLYYPDFCFERQMFNVIAGPSGSGKSTLIDAISGLIKPNGGRIVFKGCDGSQMQQPVTTSYCSQTPAILGSSLVENVILTPNAQLSSEIDLSFTDKKGLITEENLSGGERQRIGVARALSNISDIYIFDEPTAALDEQNASIVSEALRKFSQKNFVIVVSHDERLHKASNNLLSL